MMNVTLIIYYLIDEYYIFRSILGIDIYSDILTFVQIFHLNTKSFAMTDK